VTAALVVACGATPPSRSAGSALAPSSQAATGPVEPTAVSTPGPTPIGSTHAIGPIVDDLPATVDGQEVVRLDAARSGLTAVEDDSPILVGGWFHAGRIVRSCAMIRYLPAIDPCFSFAIYPAATGSSPLWIAPGDVPFPGGAGPTDATRPVVLAVHHHDVRCPSGDAECAGIPVLVALVWVGDPPSVLPSPSPFGSPPPTPLDQSAAIDAALGQGLRSLTAPVARTVTITRASAVIPGGAPSGGDPWVWAIAFDGTFVLGSCGSERCVPASNEIVVIDYVTGKLLYAAAPAP
jgi:hypothetical protein